jgi:hypothetical protein
MKKIEVAARVDRQCDKGPSRVFSREGAVASNKFFRRPEDTNGWPGTERLRGRPFLIDWRRCATLRLEDDPPGRLASLMSAK